MGTFKINELLSYFSLEMMAFLIELGKLLLSYLINGTGF